MKPSNKPLIPIYYRASDASQPVRDFIRTLRPEARFAVNRAISLISELCTELQSDLVFPHSSQIHGDLRELRCRYSRHRFRILYRRYGRLVVLLHILDKHSEKLPQWDIDIAEKRWRDIERRLRVEPRMPPRPYGDDAP